VSALPNHNNPNATPLLGERWWMPSAFAILALILLLAVPAVVDNRLGKVRSQIVLATESARVPVNDLEASFASQLLVRNGAVPPQDIPAFATRAKLNADFAALGDAVRKLGLQTSPYYKDLSDRLSAWDGSSHDGAAPTAQEGLDLLASAERLDSVLTSLANERRIEVQRLERIDFLTPLILAPIALIAIMIVMWAERRTLRFAQLAEDERAHVVQAGEARAALLRGVTHDIKNPLGAAAGYAELLEDGVVGPIPEKQLDMVRRIHRLVKAAVQTIADLLEIAQADGELHVQHGVTDLDQVVSEVVDDHRGMARERGIDVDVDAEPTSLVTDQLRVREILANLVSNAIKYTPSGGHVRVSIVTSQRSTDRGKAVGIEVRDTGPGIPSELHERVFDEFFRVPGNGAKVENGNGLGLAISRRLARLLGGDVTLADADGGGAVFTLWFPPSASGRERVQENVRETSLLHENTSPDSQRSSGAHLSANAR
jgi:signal transduction histidine kinase